ncbi:MAG: uracil phosphoribosyltransferase [Cytophagales bacterium]|nr:uracil phosphoribosyltransferase [Bernardetiaceae bacterium]MDW8203822.1 uracil phosphoribosyltransferase [Cytophagales bacterium]
MFILTQHNNIAHHFIAELRDIRIQRDRMRFRRNLERLGEIMAYEISKTMRYRPRVVETPLGFAHMQELTEQPILVPILRAGLPFYQGFLNFFDHAPSAFIGAFRGQHAADFTFEIEMRYIAAPDLNGRELILIDPMLATGKSVVLTVEALLQYGVPATLHIVSAIASKEGVAHVQQHLPNSHLWTGALDEELNHKFYIVPGLGDAGDLAFGAKIST